MARTTVVELLYVAVITDTCNAYSPNFIVNSSAFVCKNKLLTKLQLYLLKSLKKYRINKKQYFLNAKIIDPKNKHTVGKSWANLGNHVLLTIWISCIVFVIYASY